MTAQIPLNLGFTSRLTFDQFWAGGNDELVQCLRRVAEGHGEPFVFLWGQAGLGKSHLLQATSQLAHQRGQSVSYLPMHALGQCGPELFGGLEEQDLVCIDDIDRILGEPSYERSLFALYNQLREREHALVVSAARPPADLPTQLPDLGSRLSWGLVFRLQPLNDADTLGAIGLYAREMGLDVPPQVARFLLSHCRRDLASLQRLLEKLDRASLAAQRKLTIPFVRNFLQEIV
jgi:DnaA family protein